MQSGGPKFGVGEIFFEDAEWSLFFFTLVSLHFLNFDQKTKGNTYYIVWGKAIEKDKVEFERHFFKTRGRVFWAFMPLTKMSIDKWYLFFINGYGSNCSTDRGSSFSLELKKNKNKSHP